jgi:acyl carrier protein phosphodiesterase
VNYLAHALLSEPHAYSLLGNIAGDLIKGRLDDHVLHPRVADGVRRHRRVDALTDAHPRYRDLRRLFPATQRRVAPIVLDVLFDHYLTRDWRRFSAWDRGAFIEGVYRVLSQRGLPRPPALARVAPRWVAADWLRAYESLDGVAAVLDRLARRTSRPLPLRAALEVAAAREDELAEGFCEVFLDVRARLDGLAPRPEAASPRDELPKDGETFPSTP